MANRWLKSPESGERLMTDRKKPETLADIDLEISGGVYVQEVPSGVFAPRTRNAVLFFDEADGVKQPTPKRTVFEPNDEP